MEMGWKGFGLAYGWISFTVIRWFFLNMEEGPTAHGAMVIWPEESRAGWVSFSRGLLFPTCA